MPPAQPASSPPEFRRYRRFLSWLVLGFVSLGSAYMLVSVGVSIYRRRNAVPLGERPIRKGKNEKAPIFEVLDEDLEFATSPGYETKF